MRKCLLLCVLALLPLKAFAAPGVTLTATLTDLSGAPISGAQVVLTLVNYGNNIPVISGTSVQARLQYTGISNGSGVVSITIYGNYQINPKGTAYQIQIIDSTSTGSNLAQTYQFNTAGTYDLSSISPLTVIPPPIGPVPTNILTGNNTFTGTNTFSSSLAVTGTFSAANLSTTGTATFTGGGTFSGTFTGSPTFSGNPTFSSNPIFSGNPTFSGTTVITGPITENAANTGNIAAKNFTADHVQYVSTSGNDSNDGLSWGSAKLTPNAAITAIGASGGTILFGAGTYSPPTCSSIVSGTQFIGWSSPTSVPFSANMTQFTFTSSCLLNDKSSIGFYNIAFDFSSCTSACGLELRSTSTGTFHNKFEHDMFLQCGGGGAAGTACIKLNASAGTNINVVFNYFSDLQIYCNNTTGSNPGPAIGIQFIGSGPVNAGSFATVNTFHDILVRGGVQGGVDFELNTDSNYLTGVQVLQNWASTPSNSYIVAFNLNTPASDQDADDETVQAGITGAFTSYVREGQASGNLLDALTAGVSGVPVIGVTVTGGTPQFCGRLTALNGTYSVAGYCYIGTQEIFNQQTFSDAGSGAGNYTGTNTTYATVDSTNLCSTITVPKGFKAIITAAGNLYTSTAAVQASLSVADVGTTCAGAGTTPLDEAFSTGAGAGTTFPIKVQAVYVFTGDGNAHSFAIQAKTSNAADGWGIANNSSTNAPKLIIQFIPST